MAETEEQPQSLWMRFRTFLKTLGALLVELTGAVALIVFVVLIGTLAFEQVRYWMYGADTDALARRDFLCTQHVIDRPEGGADPLDVIAFDISLLKEKARAFAQPNDPIGRLRSFLVCATISGVSTSGVDLKLGGARTQLAGLPAAELITLEREEIALIKDLFPEVPPRLIAKIENMLEAALTIQVSRQQAELAAATPPPPPTAGNTALGGNTVPIFERRTPVAVSAEEAEWLLIVGADRNERAAADQVRQTRDLLRDRMEGLDQIGLFLVRDWRRTVIPFETRGEAEEARQLWATDLVYGADIKSVADFCTVTPPTMVDTWTGVLGKTEISVPVHLCSE